MDALKAILDAVLGQFVCEDGGVFRGQCPQLPKYMARKCGLNWTGATGDGKNCVDRVVQLGGYYGESSRGYRICSSSDGQYGHTWVELKLNGRWVVYEQNVKRAGTNTADFGCGTVYSVSTTDQRGAWRDNARYAAHPVIDAFIDTHPAPVPPAPQPADIKVGDTVIPTVWVDYSGNPLMKTRDYYFVSELNGDRAVLRADSMEGAVYAAMNIANLKKVNAAPAPAPEPTPEPFKVGDKVVPTKLVDYNGTPLVQYDDYYTISEINGDRAVLTAPRNGQPVVWAAMNTANIRKA